MVDELERERPETGGEDSAAERLRTEGDLKGRGPRRRLSLPFRIFLSVILLVLLVAVIGYGIYSQWLADPQNVRKLAISQIGRLFPEKDARVESASFSLSNGLDLYGVSIAEKGTGAAVAKIDQLHIDLDSANLRRGRFLPRSVTAKGVFLDLVRSTDGEWNIPMPTSTKGGPPSERLAMPFTLRLESAFVSVDDRHSGYSVSVPVDSVTAGTDDESLSSWRMSATFGGAALGSWRLSARGDVEAKRFEAQFAAAALETAGLENRLPPQARNVYLKFDPSGPVDIAGTVSYAPRPGWDFDILATLNSVSGIYEKVTLEVTHLNGQMHFARRGYDFENITGVTSGGRVAISGVGGYGRDPQLDITVTTANILADEAVVAALPDNISRAIARFRPFGRVDTTTVVHRDFGPGKPIIVAVDATLKGMAATYEGFALPVKGLAGHVSYKDRNVTIKDVTGSRGGARITIDGFVEDVKSPTIDVRIAARDIALDEEVRSLLPAKAADLWRSLSFTGRADVAAQIGKTPGGPVSLSIEADLKDAAVLYARVPYRLAAGAGRVAFRHGTLFLDDLRFRHGGAVVSASGQAAIDSGDTRLAIRAESVPVDSDIMTALPPSVSDVLARISLSGVADAEAVLTRDAQGRFSVGDITARLRGGQFLAPAVPVGMGRADASVIYAEGYLNVNSLNGEIFPDNVTPLMPVIGLAAAPLPAPRVTMDGRIPTTPAKAGWTAHFTADNLQVSDALTGDLPASLRGIVTDRDMHGLVRLSGSLVHEDRGGAKSTAFDLDVDSTDASMLAGRPLTEIRGRVRLAGQAGEGTTFSSSGELTGLAFAGRRLGASSYSLQKTDSELLVDRIVTEAVGGTVIGQGRVNIGDRPSYGFTLDFRGLDLARLLDAAFRFRKEDLTGSVTGTLSLMSHTGKSGDLIGTTEATITNGTLWEVPFILELLNVLNLRLPERTMFDRAHVQADLSENRLLIREFSMSSPPATLLGQGVIDLDGRLDLTFYARPGQIPVLSLLAGEVGKNLVRTNISGPFAEPRITLVPSGVFGRVFDWMKKPFTRRKR